MNDREQRGLALAALFRIEKHDGKWVVPSQTGDGRKYLVDADTSAPHCTCPDHTDRGVKCKHMFAVEFVQTRERNADGTETLTRTIKVTEKVTYKQDWPNYNRAQTQEKRLFLAILKDLCDGIQEPVRTGPGRRPYRLAEQVYAACFKVYSTRSGRRFIGDLEDATEKKMLDKAMHFNSVLRFLKYKHLTPILKSLIVETARPLHAVETHFAIDASGFSTSRFVRWFDIKYGKTMEEQEWVKVHLTCGVKTNVVAAAEILGKHTADTTQLPALLETTRQTFDVQALSADKGYLSHSNVLACEAAGAKPYIALKDNTTGDSGAPLARLYHYYKYNQAEFLKHYHKRSNIESTFSMIKGKFGDHVRARTDTAMANEVYCKIICHNICCLIHSLFELGIEAKFWGRDEMKPTIEVDTNSELLDALAWM